MIIMEEKKKRFRPTLRQYREQAAKIERLEKENEAYATANRMMEDELKVIRDAIAEAGDTIKAMDVEIYNLCHRGFWARVFNK